MLTNGNDIGSFGKIATSACVLHVDLGPGVAHRGGMLHDTLLALALIAALVLLDIAALRWGVDTRTPELIRETTRLET